MFTNKQLSDENRKQISDLLNDLWGEMVQDVAKSRNLEVAQLNMLADELRAIQADSVAHYGLVDGLIYPDEYRKLLREKSGWPSSEEEDMEKIRLVKVGKYANMAQEEVEEQDHDAEIAVVYALGGIVDGDGDGESVGSATFAKALQKLRKDEDVKAVVLRVNSPGGSALASDIIWRELTLLKEEKPVVASYGDVAASGGYYISAACDRIFAEPTTITGSIGVIGLLWNAKKFYNEELGVYFDPVQTNTYADLGATYERLSDFERKRFQSEIDHIYTTFMTRVKDGRGFESLEEVDALGGGHVYSGKRALI